MIDPYKLEEELEPLIKIGQTEDVIQRFSDELRCFPTTDFHKVLALDFTNDPDSIGKELDQFFQQESARYEVAAIYLETNGFSINTGTWYFDLFGFKTYGGHTDYDWLADWDSDDSSSPILTGMEELQEIYAEQLYGSPQDVTYLCSLIVVAKFQDLIRRGVECTKHLNCPVFATSHDYDFIAEFIPKNKES